MRFVLLGGTRFLGPHIVEQARAAGHSVTIAHTGEHERSFPADVAHLHGTRAELLSEGGPVERARPDVLIDTFANGATGEKARQVVACATRIASARVIAMSSVDVYEIARAAGLRASWAIDASATRLPIDEDAPLRAAADVVLEHDNLAMEIAIRDSREDVDVAVLRAGAIYGAGDPRAREWHLVERAQRGERALPLPERGAQVLHLVAVERVARAVVAAAELAPRGFWLCNVVDPYTWTYAGIAALVARVLDVTWEPEVTPFEPIEHPFQVAYPILVADRRLREILHVTEPDPERAFSEAIAWLAAHGPTPSATYATTK